MEHNWRWLMQKMQWDDQYCVTERLNHHRRAQELSWHRTRWFQHPDVADAAVFPFTVPDVSLQHVAPIKSGLCNTKGFQQGKYRLQGPILECFQFVLGEVPYPYANNVGQFDTVYKITWWCGWPNCLIVSMVWSLRLTTVVLQKSAHSALIIYSA